jgi:hypothetical protein
MVAGLSPFMSVENIQLKLKQKINIKRCGMRGCSFLPDGRIAITERINGDSSHDFFTFYIYYRYALLIPYS